MQVARDAQDAQDAQDARDARSARDSINVLIEKLVNSPKENVLVFKASSHGGILEPSSAPLPYNNSLLNWVAFGEKGYASGESQTRRDINLKTADSCMLNTTSADEQSKMWAEHLISKKFLENGVDNLKDTSGCLTDVGESFLKRISYSMTGWDTERLLKFENMELSLGIYRPGEQFNNMNYDNSNSGMKLIFYFGVLGDPEWEEVILDYNCVKYFTGIDTTKSPIKTETIITNVNDKLLKGINEKRAAAGRPPLKFCWIPSTTCRVTSNLELDFEKYELSRNISRKKNNSLDCFYKNIKDDKIKELFIEIKEYAINEGEDIYTFQRFYKYLQSWIQPISRRQHRHQFKKDKLISYLHRNILDPNPEPVPDPVRMQGDQPVSNGRAPADLSAILSEIGIIHDLGDD